MKLTSLSVAFSGLLALSFVACGPSQSKVEVPAAASSDSQMEQPLGTEPVLGPNGVPLHCEVMVDKLCYMSTEAACAAAQCPMASCSIMESYPGQVQCEDTLL